MGSSDPDDGENGDNSPSITPKEAYRLNKQEGQTQSQIAEENDISQQRVSQLVNAYDSGREAGISEVQENPEAYDISEALGDDPDENNPFDTTCPACGSVIDTPDSAGKAPCSECGTTLNWDESEI